MRRLGPTVRYLGRSTVLLEIAGVRVLTDPLLRRRVGHLLRGARPPVMCDLRDESPWASRRWTLSDTGVDRAGLPPKPYRIR